MRHISIFLIGSLLLSACASKVTTTGTTAATGKYSEDLSVWRPEGEVKKDTFKAVSTTPERTRTNRYVDAKYAVTDQVNTVLDSIYVQNLSKRSIDGYTIQVYSGVKREDALNVKKKLTQSLPDLESEVEYRQPNFRVRSGKYYTRLDAQKDYLAVKKYFPNAIVIPDKIAMQ
jgi:RNA binding exosome subunit